MKKKLFLMAALVLCALGSAFARRPFEDYDDAWIYDSEEEFYTYFNQAADKFGSCIIGIDNDNQNAGFVSTPADGAVNFVYSGKNEVLIACFTNYPDA